jgi:hypothetical protein
MKKAWPRDNLFGWLFAALLLTIGIGNLIFIHPVPAAAYALVSLIYMAPIESATAKKFGFTIPRAAKVILGITIIWFTLGVSDLGNMIDKVTL